MKNKKKCFKFIQQIVHESGAATKILMLLCQCVVRQKVQKLSWFNLHDLLNCLLPCLEKTRARSRFMNYFSL